MSSDLEEKYNFCQPSMGTALVIINEEFHYAAGRKGAQNDKGPLKETLEHLGFDVKERGNLTLHELRQELKEVSQADHSKANCFMLIMSTHGTEHDEVDGNVINMVDQVDAKDGNIRLKEITRMFRDDCCPTLAGKPKLFFIQACRGRRLAANADIQDDDLEMDAPYSEEEEEEEDGAGYSIVVQDIPIYQDFLLAYATPPGFFSWRYPREPPGQGHRPGCWFLIALCQVLKEHGHNTDLQTMLTLISHQMAYKYHTIAKYQTEHRRIVPWVASMLTKLVYFQFNG